MTSSALDLQPRRGGWLALAVFLVAALTLCWPALMGNVLAGDDYQLAGWAFRKFGAEYWRAHHAVPLWNPYIFGGLPYVGGMHGDIFYPTAWLRYFLPLDLATNLTFAGHIVIAGVSMYALVRALGVSWVGSVVAGIAYEMTGIVASQVSPGHDGKLFVSALAPLLLLGLWRGIRERKLAGYGAAALTTGLMLHGHPQTGYYLLVAAGLWTLFLVFGGEGAPQGNDRWKALGWSAVVVVIGLGMYAIQALPFIAYIPFSPRGAGGPSAGWEYATGYAMPTAELFTVFLPELNGVRDAYAGANFIKTHTEYLGAIVLMLAACGFGGAARKRERLALAVIGGLFLLVALGGHTPFYRVWYEVMPMMKKVRAAGMAFYLVALPVAVYVGFGVDRLARGEVALRRVLIWAGVFAFFGLIGAVGGLDGIAQALAAPERLEVAIATTPQLHAGALRLFIVAVAGAGVLAAIRLGKLSGGLAAATLITVVVGDMWSLDRKFFVFNGSAEQLFGNDQITAAIEKTPLPYRVWDPKGRLGSNSGLEVYQGSWLMGHDIPQLFGYHGQELNTFDELWGGKNDWKNQVNLGLLKLYAVRYVVLSQAQTLPGFHQVLGPVRTDGTGRPGILYEADTLPPYVRLMAGAVKAPAAQVADVASDARFPVEEVAIYPDSAPVSPTAVGSQLPPPAKATPKVTAWEAGSIKVGIEGQDERPLYLVVSENWYKDWTATVDGKAVPVMRAQNALLSVEVPPGGKEVSFVFRSPEYEKGKWITLLSLLAALALWIVPSVRRPREAHA